MRLAPFASGPLDFTPVCSQTQKPAGERGLDSEPLLVDFIVLRYTLHRPPCDAAGRSAARRFGVGDDCAPAWVWLKMKTETLIDKSGAYFISQYQDRVEDLRPEGSCHIEPAITIAHQSGAGAPEIADHLAKALPKTKFAGSQPWRVFNHQLIESALNDGRWSKHLAANITEEKRLFLEELIDDVLDLQPPSWVLVPQVTKTILQLAQAGHVILIGHGATVVTANLTHVYHVRLTGSLPKRVERVQRLKNLAPAAAAAAVQAEDRKRKQFLKAHFHARLDNELLYDLTINTDRMSLAAAGDLIVEGAQRFFSEL